MRISKIALYSAYQVIYLHIDQDIGSFFSSLHDLHGTWSNGLKLPLDPYNIIYHQITSDPHHNTRILVKKRKLLRS